MKSSSETLLIIHAKTRENIGVRRNALSFHTVIFATTFKFHVGSVLLINLISSVPSGRPVRVEEGAVGGGGSDGRGDERAYRVDVTSFAQPVSHYIIPLSYCRTTFTPLI